MACSITMTGIPIECKDSIGGIKAAYIAEHVDLKFPLTSTSIFFQ